MGTSLGRGRVLGDCQLGPVSFVRPLPLDYPVIEKIVLRAQAEDFPNQEDVDEDGDRKNDRDLQFSTWFHCFDLEWNRKIPTHGKGKDKTLN